MSVITAPAAYVGSYSSEHGGLVEWIARVVIRGVIYRVIFSLPVGVDLVLGLVALVVVVALHRRRRRASAARRSYRHNVHNQ